MKALILAGGYATRLWPLTKERAKPLLVLNGKPLITRIVEKIPYDTDVIVTTNKKFERDFRRWRKLVGRAVEIVVEDSEHEGEKLGALGSIAYIIKTYGIEEDLLVIAGDNFFGFDMARFLKAFRGNPLVAAYDIASKEKAKLFGVLGVRNRRIITFVEKPEEPTSTLISTGCYLFPARSFELLFEYLADPKTNHDRVGDFVAYLIAHLPVEAFIFTDYWFDIGSFEGYLEAFKTMSAAKRERKGIFFGADFRGENHFSGSVFIDKGSHVENSEIANSIILSNCRIKNSVIRNCIIDEGALINESRLRFELVERGSVIKKGTYLWRNAREEKRTA